MRNTENKQALCWINQQVIPARDARISVFDHGLLYGDGIFEGLRFYSNKVFELKAHLNRLQQSARAISLTLPFSMERVEQEIYQLIGQYHNNSGYLRLVVTRGIGSLGIDPQKCPQANYFIIADELSVVNSQIDQGVKLFIATTRRMPAECLNPEIKSLNYLNNILARIEANEAGMDEAIMLNTQGYVTEGTVDNIFIIRNGNLITPPVSDGLLQGITRDIILALAENLGIKTTQTRMTVDQLFQADECFLTGTGAELIPVSQINQHKFEKPQSPLFPGIAEAFKKMIYDRCQ